MSRRTAPLVLAASVLLHASVAAALVASSGGHARARAVPSAVGLEVAVDVLEPLLATTEAPAPPVAKADRDEPTPTHTHAYPVAPSHDAHPHDPLFEHPRHPAEPARAREPEAAPAAAAPAAPVQAAAAPAAPALVAESSALPRFAIPSGTGVASSGKVATAATGDGSGVGAGDGSARAEDPTVPASAVQVAARAVHVAEAAYPAFARADDVEGEVALEIVVDRAGRVAEARVTRPAGHGFDEAALAAIRAYRFSPAERQGHAVRVRMPWTVRFRLR
jgi:TonB family protein